MYFKFRVYAVQAPALRVRDSFRMPIYSINLKKGKTVTVGIKKGVEETI
jgi:hypothetical protein